VIAHRSNAGFDDTLRALLDAIEHRGLTVFAVIDFAAGAHEAGLDLDDETVVIFGNPRGGTPLMQSDRRAGIELPLRILVWREGDDVLVGYKDPRELAQTYELSGREDVLEQMATLLGALAAGA